MQQNSCPASGNNYGRKKQHVEGSIFILLFIPSQTTNLKVPTAGHVGIIKLMKYKMRVLA